MSTYDHDPRREDQSYALLWQAICIPTIPIHELHGVRILDGWLARKLSHA